jgi:DNA invertase Pin-like site-specific DNA recombinase
VVAYLRTSSAANVGADKDSDKRQRAAIEVYAQLAGFTIIDEYYDKAVSGADRIDERPGFREVLQRLASNGAKTIIVESPDRFARDLAVQLAGHDMLKGLGISIIPAFHRGAGAHRNDQGRPARCQGGLAGVRRHHVAALVGAAMCSAC